MKILGLSAYYHDSAACLVEDGLIVAAAQEERFTRKKHDASFPLHAAAYCLRAGGGGLDAVAFYDKPLSKLNRLTRTFASIAPRGLDAFVHAMPSWMREKLWIPYEIEVNLARLGCPTPKAMYFAEHHESHAASAFYPSPFSEAAILTMDGVGEWATSTVGVGEGSKIELLEEQRFPHSLGLLYSAFTAFAGFRVNSGEYKLMGLAPYGEPKYARLILDELIDLRPDGSFAMCPRYFDYLGGLSMTSPAFAELFGGPARAPEGRITRRERDLAASIQAVTEEVVVRMARHAASVTGKKYLCLAGGVALNCVANGVLHRAGVFERLWIQPAAGDAGGALGAALHTWHQIQGGARTPSPGDGMRGALLGPRFSNEEIERYLRDHGYPYERLGGPEARAGRVARLLADGKVVGLLVGRMELGPRALGHRSILGDPRSPKMQSVMNQKIKFRESFRPFAPSVLEEDAAEYFELDVESPYMLLVAPVRRDLRIARPEADAGGHGEDLLPWVNEVRSTIPAVTHVDYSARIQTVSKARDPDYHQIISAFKALTGCGVVINTSFNVRGEPIVCTPEDAYRCFMRSAMDALVLEDCLLVREGQPPASEGAWQAEYPLD